MLRKCTFLNAQVVTLTGKNDMSMETFPKCKSSQNPIWRHPGRRQASLLGPNFHAQGNLILKRLENSLSTSKRKLWLPFPHADNTIWAQREAMINAQSRSSSAQGRTETQWAFMRRSSWKRHLPLFSLRGWVHRIKTRPKKFPQVRREKKFFTNALFILQWPQSPVSNLLPHFLCYEMLGIVFSWLSCISIKSKEAEWKTQRTLPSFVHQGFLLISLEVCQEDESKADWVNLGAVFRFSCSLCDSVLAKRSILTVSQTF